MKILLTGACGQLGQECVRQWSDSEQLIALERNSLDITDYGQVREVFARVRPDTVVHCAAYTNVDGAEGDWDGAFRVNVLGTQHLAAQCQEYGAKLMYISTDYVFDGRLGRDYREYDRPDPLNVYGRTKLQGEELVRQLASRHYIVRTSWLYGNGQNFVKTMLNLAGARERLQVVNDQYGTPTFTRDLVRVMHGLLTSGVYGTYHVSGNGRCSWYDFACRILSLKGCKTAVEPVDSNRFCRAARRPGCAVLENYMLKMTIGDSMPHWEEALQDYLAII